MLQKLQAYQEKRDQNHVPGWEPPRVGDLVMVRRHALDNQKGKKLEARWHGPVRAVRLSASGNSMWIEELHVPGEKRYHVDDLKVYVQRHKEGGGAGVRIQYENKYITWANKKNENWITVDQR